MESQAKLFRMDPFGRHVQVASARPPDVSLPNRSEQEPDAWGIIVVCARRAAIVGDDEWQVFLSRPLELVRYHIGSVVNKTLQTRHPPACSSVDT